MGTRWGQVGVWVAVVLGLGWHAAIAEAQQATAKSNVAKKTPVDPLITEVQDAIDITTRRYLSGEVHTPWQIMHGLLALRQDYRIKRKGEKVSALDWVSQGATYRGEPWFQKTRYGGRAHPFSRPKVFEGHPNQTLAILAMADVPADHKLVTTGTQTITVKDLVRNAQMEVKTGEEVTWTLWALSHYLGPDASWRNKNGESWSIERMVRIQTQEPVSRAACGGSHGLFALTFARNVYLKSGKPLRGVWLAADQKIQRYIREAQANQNRDWSFSTNYFSGRRYSRDFETRLNTSGHTLEFLVLALPKKRLNERWIRKRRLRGHQRPAGQPGQSSRVRVTLPRPQRVGDLPRPATAEGRPRSRRQEITERKPSCDATPRKVH